MEQNITDYATAAKYLKDIYHLINVEYFNNELCDVTITIQKKAGTFGHFSLDRVWRRSEDRQHEINISAAYLNRPVANVIATLMHEAVHLYNFSRGVMDVSSNGVYHNKVFKTEAEKRDLIIEKHQQYGWTITTPSPKLIQWVEAHGLTDIPIYREDYVMPVGIPVGVDGNKPGGMDGTVKPPKKKCSTRKYVCPVCSLSVRATKEVFIICGNDMTRMEAER
ncbi:MAG: SprT-like family [Herbinix sp.]|jgi:hypothetical protein|nr:SprT-like family [Herbinix sp.]